MSGVEIGALSIAALIGLIYSGMHVPIALLLVAYVGVWLLRGDLHLANTLIASTASEAVAGYIFGVVPLFVLMGLLVSTADLGRDAFAAAGRVFAGRRGGLGVATVAASAVFAAITGISIAAAAVFTKVAVPEMRRSGYAAGFAVGIVAGSSVLGMLIPPSLLMIVFAVLSEQSVGDLFIAGIVPGILLAVFFAATVVIVAVFFPRYAYHEGVSQAERIEEIGAKVALVKIAPIAILAFLVLGGIYGGVFTPTEAGAAGALGALIIALAKRRLSWPRFLEVLIETGYITASICLLIIGAAAYSRLLALSGVNSFIGVLLTEEGFAFWQFMLLFVAVVILLGTILDSVSIMLIMVPLVLPALTAQQVDLVWFGIVTITAVEIGLLTPPFGLSVYVIKSTLNDDDVSLGDIFAGSGPFVFTMFIVLLLLIMFPALVTGLVR